jgi:hypothetical protein
VSFWISAQDCRHASMWWNGQDWGRVCGGKDASHGSTSRYAYPYRPQVAEQTCCTLKLMRLGSLRAHFWTARPTCARLWGLWGWGSFSYARIWHGMQKRVWQLAKGASEQDSRVQRGPRGKRTMRETAGRSVGSGLCTKISVEEFLICIEELKVYCRVVHNFSYFLPIFSK